MRALFKPLLLFLLATLTVVAVGTFLRLDAAARQKIPRRAAAPKGGRYVNAGDCELFIQERGGSDIDDPVMLFVGGRGEWSGTWSEWARMAADYQYHTVAVDLPPFGYSTKPTGGYTREEQAARIKTLVESLHARTVILVAHGLGAGPAITAATHLQSVIASVLLISPELETAEPAPVSDFLLANSFMRPLIASVVTNPKLQRSLLERESYRKDSITEATAAPFAQPMNVVGKSEETSEWLLRPRQPLPDDEFLGVPAFVTIFAGDHDPNLPHARRISGHLRPPTDFQELKGVGQNPALEDPEQFRGAFGNYLGSLFELLSPIEPTEP
jgi:pimeloyl-ACP methyl ester carboxylesterase